MSEERTELIPSACSDCGGEGQPIWCGTSASGEDTYRVQCEDCENSSVILSSWDNSITAWNKQNDKVRND